MKLSEILKCAVSHISKRGGWTKGAFARDKNGEQCGEQDGVSFCAWGAIRRCALFDDIEGTYTERYNRSTEATIALERVIGEDVPDWNDMRSRRKHEVVAAFRTAITNAEADEAKA